MSGAHTHTKSARHPGRRRFAMILGVVGVVAGVGAAAAASSTGGKVAATPTTAAPAHAVVSTRPLAIVSASPVDGATGVPSDATVTVQFSEPLSAHTPMPTLTPPVAGSWQLLTPTTLAFVAAAPLVPSSTETLTVPAGAGGVQSAGGVALGQGATVRFTVAAGSTLRLQQLLAQLGYLPVGFAPAGAVTAPQELAQPQEGTFTWRNPEPASLTALWTPGTANVLTKGAVMTFENTHGMTTDGQAGPAVWTALLADAAAGKVDSGAYNYVYVDKALPQRVTVYSNGAAVYTTLANTGVAGADTAVGTFPVFEHLTVTTMSGTNPDGSKYHDPGIPWVSYFNGGDALHGFVRPGYGYPQSNGCVEMPPANAAVVYPYTPIGTLVTVA
ncbi:MAG TPA: L,D-transpeptidase family protein [Acidimicrobiales bacterium]|nr:L,D-transpeptidase family protein [Acidimicrobiales bacterium]